MLLLMLGWLALAGPVDDARAAIDAHGAGKDTAPLAEALQALQEAPAGSEATAPAGLAVQVTLGMILATDGPERERGAAFDQAVGALERAGGQAPEAAELATSLALVATQALRRAPQDVDWSAWYARGHRIAALMATLNDSGGGSIRAQLADQLARYPEQPASQGAGYDAIALSGGYGLQRRTVHYAEQLMVAGTWPDAAAHARAGLERWPRNTTLQAIAGGALLRAGQPEQALPHLDEAIGLTTPDDPVRAQAMPDRALALVRLGRAAEAIEALDAALKVAPTAALHYELARQHVALANAAVADGGEGVDAARPHWRAAIPHLQAAAEDPRFAGPAGQALAFCEQRLE